jgi:hypothetical protein
MQCHFRLSVPYLACGLTGDLFVRLPVLAILTPNNLYPHQSQDTVVSDLLCYLLMFLASPLASPAFSALEHKVLSPRWEHAMLVDQITRRQSVSMDDSLSQIFVALIALADCCACDGAEPLCQKL